MAFKSPVNEVIRLETLYSYNILDTLSEKSYDAITKIASTICETPISAITFIDKSRQWFKSIEGLDVSETLRDIVFCSYTILQDDILIVNDTLNDTRFWHNPLVLDNPKIRFYAGVPLKTHDGYNIGTLCVIDRIPRELTQKQIDSLYSLAIQVISLLELKTALNKLQNKQNKLDMLLENTETSIWSIDKNHKFISFNSTFKSAFENSFGFSPQVGKLINDKFDLDKDKYKYWTSLYNRAFAGEKFTVESEISVKDKNVYLEISLNPVVSNNEVVAVTVFTKDITERKLKDLKIIESENKFKTVFDFSQIGMALLTTQVKWLKLNDAFCKILGYSENELLGKTFQDITHPDDLAQDLIYISEIVEEKVESYQREKRYIHKKGHIIWAIVSVSLMKNIPDKSIYLLLQVQNITRRKISELKLAESESKFRSAFDYSSIGMALINTNGQWLKVNKSLCNIFGYKEQEFCKKTLEELSHIEDSKDNAKYYKQLLNNEIKSFQIERRYYHYNSHIIWLSLNISAVYNDSNKQIYFIVQAQDITQRKEAEKSLLFQSNILQNVQDCIIITDLKGNITYWNQGATSIFGYQPNEIINQKITELYPDNDQLTLKKGLADIASVKNIKRDWKGKTKDGKEIWLDLKTSYLQNKEGKLIGFIGVARDITDKKEIEKELISAKEQAEEALHIKSEFLATMSHEIRTPMNGVIGMTDLLSKTKLNEEQNEFLDIIRKSNNSLMTIINEILDFSKFEANKMQLEKIPFDLRTCIQDIYSIVSGIAEEKKIELVYYVSLDIPQHLLGDINRIRQVLLNLVNNGIKFSNKGELFISVELLKRTDNILTLKFIIKDTGIGIAKEIINNLFQPFSQGDSSTSRKYGGTGLGLAITKKIVELMNGKIWVESQLGQGSEFHFTIDLELADIYSENSYRQNIHPKLLNKRALLVVNNSNGLNSINDQTKQWGMLNTIALSYSIALGILKNNPSFDVVIIDLSETDTKYMLKELHKLQPSLPVIILISSDKENLKVSDKLFSDCLIKPVKEITLFNALINTLFKRTIITNKNNDFGLDFAISYPLNILLAEDNIINQKLVNKILEKMGYKIDIANNGFEAIEAVKNKYYDIILMDIQMPEMSGIEATQYILSNFSESEIPKIIALTANAMQGDREICINAGMVDYITKPISIKILQDTLIKWSNKHQPQDKISL